MDNQSVEAMLKQQLNAEPENSAAAVALGNHYFDQQQPIAAIAYYQLALANNPDQPNVMTDMATMYWRNNDVGLAERYFRMVVDKFPEAANAYINLGLLYLHAKGDQAGAKAVWQQLLAVCPEHNAAAKARELLQGIE